MHCTRFLLHCVAIGDYSPSACKNAFDFAGKALVVVIVAFNDQDTEFLFKQADSGRQRRLRDKARLGGTAKVLLAFQRYQES